MQGVQRGLHSTENNAVGRERSEDERGLRYFSSMCSISIHEESWAMRLMVQADFDRMDGTDLPPSNPVLLHPVLSHKLRDYHTHCCYEARSYSII